jgi:radical SAM superfamily enzyme
MNDNNVIFLTGVMTPWFERSIAVYQLSNFIKKHGYTTQVIDFIHLIPKNVLLDLLKKFTNNKTQVLALSSTFIAEEVTLGLTKKTGIISNDLQQCLTEYKLLFPHVKLIVGGANARKFKNNNLFDFYITGYGELALLNFLKNGDTRSSKFIDGDMYLGKFDSSKIDHMFCDQDLIFEGETLPIEISRGCIFRCKFCAYPLNGKRKLDHIRDVDLIKNELINNYEKWGVTNYLILDDTFNDSNEKLIELHDMIVALPFKINFVCYLRVDLLYHFRDTQIEMLERMGLKSCHFGVESFNPKTAKFIGKGLSEDKTKDFLLFLKERWQNKISFMCTFIVGLPFETKESCIETGEWCVKNDITFWTMPLFIDPARTYKSDIDINYEKYGYVLNQDDCSWTTDFMTFHEALQISNRFTTDHNDHKISAWNMFALLTFGIYSIDELYHMTYRELHTDSNRTIFQNKVKSYIERLNRL